MSSQKVAIPALLVLCVAAFRPASGTGLSEMQKNELLHQARTLFKKGDELRARSKTAEAKREYLAGALRLKRIADEGRVRNGRLFYNIGNYFFRAGDIGRAILYYRRAERFLPNDPNLRQNLAFARKSRKDRVPESSGRKIARTILFLHYDLSPYPKTIALIVLFNIAALLGFVRLVRPRFPFWPAAAALALALLLILSLAWVELDWRRSPPGVVVAESVMARKGDGEGYEPSFKDPLHAGMEFRLLESRPDWYYIELPDGRKCWIPQTSAELALKVRPGSHT